MFRSRTRPSTARRRPLGVLLALALLAAMAGVLLGPAGPAHAAGSKLYVADEDTDSVVVVDTAGDTTTATIPVAPLPEYTAVTPDGSQVFVSSIHAISVISTSSDTVTATIPIDSYVPADDTARQVTVDPAGAFAYVVTEDGYVLKIATATDTVTGTVRAAESTPAMATRAIAISPDGATLYVSGDSSSVSVVDTAALTVRSVIDTGDSHSWAIAVAPDGSHVYVAYNHHFAPQESVVDVISTATSQLTATIPVATYDDGLQGIAVTPDGASVYVTASVSNTVSVISTVTNTVAGTVSGLEGPVGIALNSAGTTAWVSQVDNGNGSIAVIDTASNTITGTIPGLGLPFGLSVGTSLPVPAVTGVSPGSGPSAGGNTVTVTGTGFTGASAVSFGTNPAASFTVNSDTSITATVPAGAVGIDDVTVTTPGGTSATSAVDQYIYHPTCTTTITGANSANITVSSGLTCLVNATQAGPVTVEAGAALSVTDSTISGSLTATDPAGITYCGSTESGNLTVTGATGPVVLSGTLPDGTACAADTISGSVTITGASAPVTVTGLKQRGTLTLENDTAGVDLNGGHLNGQVNVSDNTATAPAAITVSGVTVTGSLSCTGNSPAPADAGTLNTVSAVTASDQCTAIEQH